MSIDYKTDALTTRPRAKCTL